MKQVILEYTGAAVAVFGAVAFFRILGLLFMSSEGLLAILVRVVLGGF